MPVWDSYFVACLVLLAVWVLISGLDDLVVDLAFLCSRFRARLEKTPGAEVPAEHRPTGLREKRIAVFLPLWHEDGVVGTMLEHNIAAVDYWDYAFFVGVYPNDEPTLEAVKEAEARFHNVHLCVCPHDGPTSKADNLNWIYQQMLLHEEEYGTRFEAVVTHDAEDLIHPKSLRWISDHLEDADMVQIPVLPLPTPFSKFTHGVYCDEFAEYQTKDVPVRQMFGGFIPSNGVGTGYSRAALDKLASEESNRIFDPSSLTEDYENGIRLHRLGCRQLFVPIRMVAGRPVATREYFPSRFRNALKQRTRWVMGIALQSWEQHGWSGSLCDNYWFWRDRKGLAGNPITLLANAIFLYGLCTWLWSLTTGTTWLFSRLATHPAARWLFVATLLLQVMRIGMRAGCVGRIYGWKFALGVPFRVLWANWINCLATLLAVHCYTRACLRNRPLIWVKTDHAYPSRDGLVVHKRRLGEVLVGSMYLSQEDLEEALASMPPEIRLGEHLVRIGKLGERELYEALSLQQSLPLGQLDPEDLSRSVGRALPASVVRKWKVLPFRIASGQIFLAGPELPTDRMHQELRRFTSLRIHFELVTPSNFLQAAKQVLGVKI